MNAYFIRGLLFGRALCVVICSGLLQFLIRPHLWVFAALVFFSMSGARAADIVPVDSEPAKICNTYLAGWSGLPAGTEIYGCSHQEAGQNAYAAMYAANQIQCQRSSKYRNCSYFDYSMYAWGIKGDECTSYDGLGGCATWSGIKLLATNHLVKKPTTYVCPPDLYPDYTIGPLEKEDGSKWCAKEYGPPEQTPEEKCANYKDTIEPSIQYFFLEDSTCVSGCEIKPIGDGVVYMPVMLSDGQEWNFTSGLGAFTGAVCPHGGDGGEGEVPAPDDAPKEAKPTEEKNDCQPVYNAATGVSTCTATSTSEDPGKYKCGHVNGVWTCVKVGNQKTTETAEKQSQTTTNEDGSTTTTDTVKTTTTTCKGDQCTTTTKTTTTTTTKDAQGNTTGTSDKCEGDGCGPGGGGGGGDSDGDGYPDAGDWYEPTEKTFETVLGEFRSRVSQAPFATAVGTFLTLHAGGSCPVWSADVPIFGTVVFDQWCGAAMGSVWPIVSAVILAVCSFFAFRIAFLK